MYRIQETTFLTPTVQFVEISNVIDIDKFDRLLSFVSKEKREKINRFHFDISKKLSLYSEILVRTIICKELNIYNDKIAFEQNLYGKPYLKAHPNFHFNLSHTRNAITIGVSNKQLGVDIEKIRMAEIPITKRFFTEGEVAYITKTEINTDNRFYEVWTKKESYIKFIGKGLSIPLNSFDVFDSDIDKQIYTFEQYDYMISVCSECPKFVIAKLLEKDVESMAIKFLQ